MNSNVSSMAGMGTLLNEQNRLHRQGSGICFAGITGRAKPRSQNALN